MSSNTAVMSDAREWRLEGGQYLGEISALCFLHLPSDLSPFPVLLAGTGSQILLFDVNLGRFVRSFHVFEGIRVHGISCSILNQAEGAISSSAAFKIVLFGERRVKLFSLHFELESIYEEKRDICAHMTLLQVLPRFRHWVLDVCFFWDDQRSSQERHQFLAVGCSNNTVHIWNILTSTVILEVRCPERCLLYSMRLWGHELEALQVASGTIYNEVVVWKVVEQQSTVPPVGILDNANNLGTLGNSHRFVCRQFEADIICRLAGHQGSIFRISWSNDGSKLVSVSDDRSARIWILNTERGSDDMREMGSPYSVGHVLFGHKARIWDCSISDHLIVTAGEDCTCRLWGLDGHELKLIKDHIGRGIWRCLYDPSSSLLATAGFDSSIKVHEVHASLSKGLRGFGEEVNKDREEVLMLSIPNASGHMGLMNSKSEYVRCLQFACVDTIYVATNHGYVYHVKLSDNGSVKWTKLVRASDSGPVICMDVFPRDQPKWSISVEDRIAIGDGKGGMTVVNVFDDGCGPTVVCAINWSAEMERQLLGVYWCKTLGFRYIFTSDPRGLVKLWRLSDTSHSLSKDPIRNSDVYLVAEFMSSFGSRIMCLCASVEEEVLVCGDLRGNLLIFPLSKSILLDRSVGSIGKMRPLTYFKGAHGISTVSSISITQLSRTLVEISSTGGDGCICYLEYDKGQRMLEFVGMKQVKELSLIESVSAGNYSLNESAETVYAVGFSSADFLVWNLMTETKVVHVTCGGWRRPHSYYLGCVSEVNSCFAYVKDEIIYVHRHRAAGGEKKIFPQDLHLQFHGREVHSICFIYGDCQFTTHVASAGAKPVWIATGCEDGTVRLTRYNPGAENWSMSKLLGEHVGGSAVRSMCLVSKIHSVLTSVIDVPNWTAGLSNAPEISENFFLLISVGAKRVLTSWLLKNGQMNEEGVSDSGLHDEPQRRSCSLGNLSLLSFKWLSTDMPTKFGCSNKKTRESEKSVELIKKLPCVEPDSCFVLPDADNGEKDLKLCRDLYENDWRYMAVTAFLVKLAESRLTVCFIAVASSDATLTLRALVLPSRYWFDVAVLVRLSSPVLALQHIVIPFDIPFEGRTASKNLYVVISGSTDGSIAFWDISESVESFLWRVSSLHLEKSINSQKRPRTGRGSQGGRWWRSIDIAVREKKQGGCSAILDGTSNSRCNMHLATSSESLNSEDSATSFSHVTQDVPPMLEANPDDSSVKLCEITPFHILHNVHHAGVNCLSVSGCGSCQSLERGFLYNIVSGGDDQALTFYRFDFVPAETSFNFVDLRADSEPESSRNTVNQYRSQSYRMRFLYQNKVVSAHSSAVKGVWTDGNWVFSVGLDQRVRCWNLEEPGKLTEHSHFIISVPEPEALDALAYGRNCYQIAVAGRGMQVVDFSASYNLDAE
ncbi:hypothetical protein Ancab_022553 [Ancistrocladus abbreviatus]